jgi:BirA family biotin operon repressor/biotin-[acetyl-CoA-carboxylase] ligase
MSEIGGGLPTTPAYQRGPGPAGTRFGEVRRFVSLDSTNRYLLQEARAGGDDGLVAVARHQTAGRGRLGRRWEAPAGSNLLMSVLLRPGLAPEDLHLCTVAVALAARAACAVTSGVEAGLKWPNDLVVGERKLAGILAESEIGAGAVTVVVGLGLNVAWPTPEDDSAATVEADPGADPVPEELRRTATSLWRESGRRLEADVLVDAVLRELDGRIEELGTAEGRRRLASAYRAGCVTLGRTVTVTLEGESVTGPVADITSQGHLVVDVGTCLRTITAGDVVHLRPPA